MNLVIIEEGIEKPESGQEIISFVFNKGIISEYLFSRLEGVIGFRNILVHEYGIIDHKRVYQFLKGKLEDFEFFKKEILNFIKKQEEK